MIAITAAVPCPRCARTETTPLAREGDLQRYQCTACQENFSAPAQAMGLSPAPAAAQPSGTAFAPIAPPDPADIGEAGGAVAGKCTKCGKPYLRLGKKFDEHVTKCDGTPFVPKRAPAGRVGPGPAPAAALPAALPAGLQKAVELSIEALKIQRSVLEAEIRDLNGCISTLEKLRAPGGEPAAPFPAGA